MWAWMCRPAVCAATTTRVLLAGGAGQPRDLPVPGRELAGVHFAMDYLTLQNKRCEGDEIPDADFITAHGKHVIIIGGGDTGADCLGTAHRQGAASGASARAAAAAAAGARGRQPVAAVAADLPGLDRARRGRRASLRGLDRALLGRRSRSRPRAPCGEGGDGEERRPRAVRPRRGQRVRDPGRSGPARDGLRRSRRRARCSPTSV